MYTINKIVSDSVVDFASEELKKYLRMMMPECGDIKINFNPDATDGFRLGLMQDFGLDVSDAEDVELDDILYIDCDKVGGIIAGDNSRSVLLAVYEYLRQNGCRWLLPGVEGEYIPMQDIKPVKYRFKPSCRYRGWCSEGAQFQRSVVEAIDLLPKLGMNVYMNQFEIPTYFYTRYYSHAFNNENRPKDYVSKTQMLQWKRQCETEISKRGIQFHDIGHGFNYLPLGIKADVKTKSEDIPEEIRQYLAQIGGERKFYKDSPAVTNFCMSNKEAREKIANYVAEFSKKHENIDYLHVWLADGSNNHCECDDCVKKTPSDWYIILLNEIDEKLTEIGSDMRIVFISYVDTTWAPLEETIKNSKRFTMLFAPIFRSFAYSMDKDRERTKIDPYRRNNNKFPASIGASFDYFEEWQKVWKGSNVGFDYHFWRHQCYDLSDRMQAEMLNCDVKRYKENGVDGIIACGTQRPFFPTGLSFYSFARTLFDNSLTYEEIEEDYYSHAFGSDWKLFRDYLKKLHDAMPFDFFSRDEAGKRENLYFDLDRAKKIESIREITKEGRKLMDEHYDNEARVHNESIRILRYHADFCDLIADWMAAKAKGEIDLGMELMEKARVESGKFESEIESYFDHNLYFGEYIHAQNLEKEMQKDIISID